MGRKPILDALKSGQALEKIWLERNTRGEFEVELRNLAKDQRVPLAKVALEKLNHLAKSKNHQGVVAVGALIDYQSVEHLVPYLYEKGKTPKFVLLDGIEDVRNLGAIARSALWFGYDSLIMGFKNTAPVNSIAIKISAGALSKIPVCREKSITNSVAFLKEYGFKIYGADMNGIPITEVKKSKDPFVLVMGSEFNGINPRLRSMCDEIISITGSGQIESLNVSVAAGICMNAFFNKD